MQRYKSLTRFSIYKTRYALRGVKGFISYAKELIDSGQPPTSVYEQSGFSDYTTFYRAYKKQFKVSPSTQKKNP